MSKFARKNSGIFAKSVKKWFENCKKCLKIKSHVVKRGVGTLFGGLVVVVLVYGLTDLSWVEWLFEYSFNHHYSKYTNPVQLSLLPEKNIELPEQSPELDEKAFKGKNYYKQAIIAVCIILGIGGALYWYFMFFRGPDGGDDSPVLPSAETVINSTQPDAVIKETAKTVINSTQPDAVIKETAKTVINSTQPDAVIDESAKFMTASEKVASDIDLIRKLQKVTLPISFIMKRYTYQSIGPLTKQFFDQQHLEHLTVEEMEANPFLNGTFTDEETLQFKRQVIDVLMSI